MPYIPHTQADIDAMLESIGVDSIDRLFEEIPGAVRSKLEHIPSGVSEFEISRLMHERAKIDGDHLCFIGAGAYDHHIPAAVWEITGRGEFYSAYTPYQAEASQGTLQLLYEYQSMMASLTGMDVSNASLYDGASALAEAVLMAVRCHRKSKSKKILMPLTVHPHYRQVVQTIVQNQGFELVPVAYDSDQGTIDLQALPNDGEFAALVIPQPNFFGVLEPCDELVAWARQRDMMSIACVNPTSLSVLRPPGQWSEHGADIACGEGQPLGIPLASGGPYFGFICCQKQWVRQLPGRLVGRTVDQQGKTGYTLTLQAREQHIRRSKATSNICTNQGLLITAATLYMSIMGTAGMEQVAQLCYQNTHRLCEDVTQITGVQQKFSGPYFHEVALQLPKDSKKVLAGMQQKNILAGFDLSRDYPELSDVILTCVTETKTEQDRQRYADALQTCLSES